MKIQESYWVIVGRAVLLRECWSSNMHQMGHYTNISIVSIFLSPRKNELVLTCKLKNGASLFKTQMEKDANYLGLEE